MLIIYLYLSVLIQLQYLWTDVTVVKIHKLPCTLAVTSTNPSMGRGYERSYFKLSLGLAENMVADNTTKHNTI
jgi:hypothetical protein